MTAKQKSDLQRGLDRQKENGDDCKVKEMIIKDIPKEQADLLIDRVKELRPKMNINVIAEDYVLYQLGLVNFIPCTVSIEATENEIFELVDEVDGMEIDYMNFSDEDLKKADMRNLQKELEEKYARYAIIGAWLGKCAGAD